LVGNKFDDTFNEKRSQNNQEEKKEPIIKNANYHPNSHEIAINSETKNVNTCVPIEYTENHQDGSNLI